MLVVRQLRRPRQAASQLLEASRLWAANQTCTPRCVPAAGPATASASTELPAGGSKASSSCSSTAAAMQQQQTPLAPPGFSRTFYKRQLPSPPAIEFSSARGKQIFSEALAAGTMECFFLLIEQFRTQDEPAFCGLASLAMVLNTLSIDPRRTWKGPWRWFHEEMLDCCSPLARVKEEGITLQQAACLARCNGAKVEVYPFGSVSVHDFRRMVAEAASTASEHIIVSYSRKEFLQTGDGHFSPIGGYSAREDMVLILDTARFKYPPHWVSVEMLYKAMARLDPATGKPRGFMRMGLQPRLDSVLFTLDVRDDAWHKARDYLERQLRQVVAAAAAAPGATAESVLRAAAEAAPHAALKKFIAVRTAGSSMHGGVCTQRAAIELFLRELRCMPLFAAVQPGVPPGSPVDLSGTNCWSIPLTPPPSPPPEPAAEGKCMLQRRQEQSDAERATIDRCCTPVLKQQQRQQQQEAGVAAGVEAAAATSRHAALASSAEPAVMEDLSVERACMLLFMAPRDVWRDIPDPGLRDRVLRLLETAKRQGEQQVVGIEAEYLSGQYFELPIIEAAMAAQEEARHHACAPADG